MGKKGFYIKSIVSFRYCAFKPTVRIYWILYYYIMDLLYRIIYIIQWVVFARFFKSLKIPFICQVNLLSRKKAQ